MTNHEKIKSMSLDAFVDFLDKYSIHESTPWIDWWEKNYCKQCAPLLVNIEKQKEVLGFTSFRDIVECAYCEVQHSCKYFPDKEEITHRDVLTLWLKENYKQEENKNEEH